MNPSSFLLPSFFFFQSKSATVTGKRGRQAGRRAKQCLRKIIEDGGMTLSNQGGKGEDPCHAMPEFKLAVTFLVPSFRVHLNSALVPFIGQLKFPIYQKMKEKGNGYL